jgi:ADP-ribosylglycohydrolase
MLRPWPVKNDPNYNRDPGSKGKNPHGLRLKHPGKSQGSSPSKSSPVPWSVVVPTHRRESAVEGLLLGCAVAESLSLTRDGMHPRLGLKLFGRAPLSYQFVPGVGVAGDRTQALIITIQAMLLSKTDSNVFASQISKRIAWYQRAFPFQHISAHWKRRKTKDGESESMSLGVGDDPLVRALAMSVMLQGCTDSALRWFQNSVAISHSDSLALHASVLLGYAAQLAQVVEPANFNSKEALDQLINCTDEPRLKGMLVRMSEFLSERRSIAYVAREFGWADGLPGEIYPSAAMGLYAWLRHHQSYRQCVERTVLLGGQCRGAAAVAGALSGIQLGKKHIPSKWLKGLSLYPYNKAWRENLIERVKDWPHGVEDIQRAHGVPSHIAGQILRNSFVSLFHGIHAALRFPMRLTLFSVKKRS